MSGTNERKWLYRFLIVLFIAAIYFAYSYVDGLHERADKAQQALEIEKNKPPTIQTDTKTVTQIAYVPKETVIYKDAVGNSVVGTEKTDVQLNVQPPNVYVKYNGKDYQMPGVVGETSKFEKGKFVGEVSTSAVLDVTELVEKEVARRKKHFSFGSYATNKGLAVSAGYINKNTEFKAIAIVPDLEKFYGAGIELKF